VLLLFPLVLCLNTNVLERQTQLPFCRKLNCSLQVTGANLVPFTIQKQNALSATVADLLPSVFSVRLILVDQTSPEAGQSISSAEVSLVVQQDASAIPVELASPSSLTAFTR